EVATGDEHVAGARDEQAGQIGVAPHHVDGAAHAEVHRRGHGVAGPGPVDDDVGEAAVAFEPQVGGAQPVALGRSGSRRRLAHAVACCASVSRSVALLRSYRPWSKERIDTSWPAAAARRAPTVQSSFLRTEKGSKPYHRMAFSWV